MGDNSNEKCAFSTTIRKSISDRFKETCKEMNLPMNVVLEAFMEQFSDGQFKIGLYRSNDNK